MNGTASASQWLVSCSIGYFTSVLVLGLLKLALDHEVAPSEPEEPPLPSHLPPPSLPARAPVRRRLHAAPLLVETQPIRVQPHLARHAKKAA